ncbi:hypothetical protein Tco_0638573, partial [Tanacetum coccineum]
ELTEAQQLQDDYDVQATNIILHGLPPDVYTLVNHLDATKDIWDRVKMLMKGTELSYQERECRLYNLFDKFAHVSGVLIDLILQRSSINNSARLSNKFGGFYFSFKFDISGLLHHVITTIAYRIRDKILKSKQNLQSSSMTFIHKTLIIPSVLDSCFISSTVSEVKRKTVQATSKFQNLLKIGMLVWSKLIQKLRQKGVYEESFSRHAAWIGGKLIQLMHNTMVPEQVKTMKIQAGVQGSRPEELIRHLQLWKHFRRLYLYCTCTC